MSEGKAPLVLFDGVCKLCNAAVQFILKYERHHNIRFGALQSEAAQLVLSRFPEVKLSDSIVWIENEVLYQESTAALKIARHLNYFRMVYFLIYIPAWLRDPVYRLVARNRYRWFGKRDRCTIPSAALQHRFL